MKDTNWGRAAFEIQLEKQSKVIEVSGRDRWALERLILSGPKGCTPIDSPGPRWSAYVHNLRALGVVIEAIHERHGEPYSRNHARYLLQSIVRRVETVQ